MRRLDIRPRILLDPKALQHIILGTQEPKRKEHKLRREELLRPRHLLHLPAPRTILRPLHTHSVQTLQLPLVINHKVLGRNTELSRVLTKVRSDLRMPVVRAEDPRPLRPGVIAPSPRRGLGQQLKVHDGLGPVAHRGADTVVAGVASADDDHVLALRVDVRAVLELSVEERLGVELQVLHREVDAVDFAVRDLEVARPGCAGCEDDRFVLQTELFDGDVDADVGVGEERLRVYRQPLLLQNITFGTHDAFRFHQVDTALDDRLVELHAAKRGV